MNINTPKEVKLIIDTFYKNNFEAFMVGGCVRDILLGNLPKDYDITTSAKPEITISLFDKTIPTGLKHGTVTVLINNEPYEVTTYRTEGKYIDNRRPSSVDFVTDIKEDLSRRDFTINSLAYNQKVGLIDYFNGTDDIKNKIIRCVGNADKRFKEDALRMLRAVRFSCQLNFDIEENTYTAIKNNYKLIKNISSERIRDELCKILISENPSKGLEILRDTKLLEIILPEINALYNFSPKCTNHNRNIFAHTLKVIDNTENDLLLRLSALFHDVGKLNTLTPLNNGTFYGFPGHCLEGSIMVKKILSRLRFDNNTIKVISKLIEHHLVLNATTMPTKYEVKILLNEMGVNNINLLFSLQRADINSLDNPKVFLEKVKYTENLVNEIINNREPLIIKDLNISGGDLISNLNLKPGKILGDVLNHLLNIVLEKPDLNSKETLLTLAKNFLNKEEE
ncbi:CCA tRNA nucleotidyltransferase [Clostridium sartagoforme]|uniref:CCA tRNA nucleotidyltransferase n=1 Tax=Clostridium sartagoforme TaxID=84031 RepID=A0A4S2DFF6_9CLOT|nr:CCA tRNA nucleotidyltransferase [Clostridium sartagoforme]TGY40445.1 CCA tRNA nucleotidyltransferase [Clostridium sartagoforme]